MSELCLFLCCARGRELKLAMANTRFDNYIRRWAAGSHYS